MVKKNIIIFSMILIIIISLFSCKKNNSSNDLIEYHDFTNKNVEDFFKDSGKLIVLNYWATYCAPCKKEMVDFSKLNTEYNEDVFFIGASIDSSDNISLIKKLCFSLGVNYSILYGVHANFRGNEITSLPTTYILRNGEIKEEIIGKRDFEYFKNTIEKYMTEEKKVSEDVKKNNVKVKESSQKKVKKDSVKKNMIINKFYEIDYIIKKNKESFEMRITLNPTKSFYLNGDGYPPLTIKFEEINDFKITPLSLSVDGIKEGKAYSWDVIIDNKNNKDGFNIKAVINALACTSSQCNMVNDEIIFKY